MREKVVNLLSFLIAVLAISAIVRDLVLHASHSVSNENTKVLFSLPAP